MTATIVARPSSLLVIGLGNPILGDDGVGWTVAERVKQQVEINPRYQICYRPVDSKVIHRHSFVEVDCVSLGGLSLMERMLGYRRVVIVDSMETGQSPAGSVRVFKLDELANPSAGHSASAHDTSLITALRTAEAMGMPIPKSVEIVAIEAKNVYDFSEELSPVVAEAVPLAVQAVMDLLKEEP
ncbi:MAG: hydrogenase maturation protease [Chloroflexi bacterium]|nr:hydrogenase maturation protease [Chloroflexota bacterium]